MVSLVRFQVAGGFGGSCGVYRVRNVEQGTACRRRVPLFRFSVAVCCSRSRLRLFFLSVASSSRSLRSGFGASDSRGGSFSASIDYLAPRPPRSARILVGQQEKEKTANPVDRGRPFSTSVSEMPAGDC